MGRWGHLPASRTRLTRAGAGAPRRSAIWAARRSAAGRLRPMATMTERSPRRRRTIHARSGGRPRELAEPKSTPRQVATAQLVGGPGGHGSDTPVSSIGQGDRYQSGATPGCNRARHRWSPPPFRYETKRRCLACLPWTPQPWSSGTLPSSRLRSRKLSPLRAITSAWWTKRSIMAAATASSPSTSPQRLKALLELTITLARS